MGNANSGDQFQDPALPPDYPASVAFVRRQVGAARAEAVGGIRDLEVRVGSVESASELAEGRIGALETGKADASALDEVRETADGAYSQSAENATSLADLSQQAVRKNAFDERNKAVDDAIASVEAAAEAAKGTAGSAAAKADQTLQEVRATDAKLSDAVSGKRGRTDLAVYRRESCSVTLTRRPVAGGEDVVKTLACTRDRVDGGTAVYEGESDGVALTLAFGMDRGSEAEVSAVGLRDGEAGVSDVVVDSSSNPTGDDGTFGARLSGTSADGTAYAYALDGRFASPVSVDGEALATTSDVGRVSDAVGVEAARAEAAEAAKADKTTVTALATRVSSVETKKADKTAVTALSSSVDTLKSSKRGAYDLTVYRRVVSVQLKITVADNGDGTVLGTSETGVYCTLVESSVVTETYRGQFGENSYLSLMLVVEGGEIVGGAYGEVESEGESAMITNLTYEGGNRVTGSTTLTTGAEYFLYEVKGTVENDTSTSDHGMLLTSADGAALKSSAVSDAVAQARTAAKADRPFDVADVAAGATLANATVSRFSPADASEVAFTLADPPSGKMAEYELWVDCTAAAPASLTFRLANAQIDPRVEGEVEAMAVGKAYAYRVRAFGNPDAAHVTVIISQSEAAPAGYTIDQLYAPDSAFEIDTTKGDGLSFSVQVYADKTNGDGGYVTVVWGDGTRTRKYAYNYDSGYETVTHTYAKAGSYVVRIANAANFYLAGSPMVVRALRWGDTVTSAPGTYSACPNLAGTVPPWGKAMVNTSSMSSSVIYPGYGDYGNASRRHGAFAFCTGLTGSVPPWPELDDDSTGLQVLNKTFIGCTGLTGPIPPWPKHATKVVQCFYGCTGLTGSVPAWPEFEGKPWYTSGSSHPIAFAYGAFTGCTGLTGEIPAWPALPKNSIPKLSYPNFTYADYDYFGTFAGCTGLAGKIPKWPCNTTDGAFLNAWVGGLYAGCTGLEGIWDEDAADSEVMPSTVTQHTGCVKGASEAVRRHFTAEWGGTKGASST